MEISSASAAMGVFTSKPHYKPNPYARRDEPELSEPPQTTKTPAETPRRRPFPPPSPAKHLKAVLLRRQVSVKPNAAAIQEGEEAAVDLDKSFGLSKKFASRFQVGEEVGRGHFGYTCSAIGKKGELKGQKVAVKIIPKSKVRIFLCMLGYSELHSLMGSISFLQCI